MPFTNVKFRATIQRLGLNKIRNTPEKHVLDAAIKKAAETSPGLFSSLSNQEHIAGNASSDTSSTAQNATATLSGSPTATLGQKQGSWHSTMFSGQSITKTAASLVLTEQLRSKVQDAVNQAGAQASRMFSAKSSASTGEAQIEQYYKKLQSSVQETKMDYYSRIPFDERWDDIMLSLDVLGRVSRGNQVTVYHDSADAFEAMWNAVDNATAEVMWQTYICKDDYVGQRTVKKLVAAHRRECKTELLYDSGGNISGRGRLTEVLTECGATVITYRPFFRSLLKYLFRFDWRISPGLRNHRKILLVDGRVGYCGGLNIGNEYCGVHMGGTGKFRDTHCAVVGPATSHLREVYDDTKEPQPWKFGWKRFRQIASHRFNRTFFESKHAVEHKFLRSVTTSTKSMVRRSGIYFRKQVDRAEMETNRMIERVRWRKQREQLRALMNWYSTSISPTVHAGFGSPTPIFPTAGGTSKSQDPRDVVHTIDGGQEDAVEANVKGPATAAAAGADTSSNLIGDNAPDTQVASDASEDTDATSVKRIRTGVMTRKMIAARTRTLYTAMGIPHKRRYTNMLLQVPITDTEPVPEAETYNLSRPSTTQILACNPRYHNYSIQYAFWQVTRKCHRRIWITTPYYLPTRKLFRALTHAASRGVDVRILAGSSHTTDPWFMWHASNYITERLLRSGVKIYEYNGVQIMHAKTVVVDSVWSSVGSYNWDNMSNKNLEVCLCHLNVGIAREMEKQFLRDLEQSKEVRLDDHCKRSLWLRFTSWLFYNGVYLLDRITFRSLHSQDVEDSPDTHTR